MKILSAKWVLPISSEPIVDGAVIVEGERITAVGTRDEILGRFPSAMVEDFGEAAILPGFVNCHSHLEITAMRGALDDVEHDFRSWLLKLNGLRAAMSDEEIGEAAFHGALEGSRAGVTCFGDIGRSGHAGFEALKRAGLRGVLYQETEFSPDDRTAEEDFARLREKFASLSGNATELVEVGLSPHSPYTVSRDLFRLIAEFASANEVKVSIHAAESADEDELVLTGNGFFTEVYAKFGVEWTSPRTSSIEYLESTGILDARPLLAHCVTVSESDIAIIKRTGSSIAHCPKSNAKFGHGYAPFERFLDSGVPVGLGSDSVASNNMCDILEESRFAALVARNRPGSARFISASEVLRAATLGGAAAMGLDEKIGTLEPGKYADIAVIAMDHPGQQPVNDIETALVFSSTSRDVIETLVNGKSVLKP
ncbi:MAG: amidohydrolase family protein [Pyrinomonadaceae bacterium]|nr:amidohydrolase family protein [Pyrinomonadaceae bacterium]